MFPFLLATERIDFMLSVFTATLSPMLVMFLCILIGFVLNKKSFLPDNAATVLSKLENYIIVPSLIINTFMKYCTVASFRQQYKLVVYCIIAVLFGIGLAYIVAPIIEKDSYKKNIYRYALSFANFGFMGNSIVPAILGEEILYEYLIFTIPLNIACYTWGVAILIPTGEEKKNPLRNLLNPIVFSLGIGIVLGLTSAQKIMPHFLSTTLNNLSACMGPLAMVLTGFAIGDYRIGDLLRNKKVYFTTFLRLFVLPAVILALLMLLGADDKTLILALFAFSTPLGLNTVVIPAAYGGDSATGASMAMISHTLCVITIPIMYALLMTVIK